MGTVLLFIFLSRLILKIEGLDKFACTPLPAPTRPLATSHDGRLRRAAGAFDKAREKLLSGVATDERGTPSFKPGAPPRHDSPNLQSNLQRAYADLGLEPRTSGLSLDLLLTHSCPVSGKGDAAAIVCGGCSHGVVSLLGWRPATRDQVQR